MKGCVRLSPFSETMCSGKVLIYVFFFNDSYSFHYNSIQLFMLLYVDSMVFNQVDLFIYIKYTLKFTVLFISTFIAWVLIKFDFHYVSVYDSFKPIPTHRKHLETKINWFSAFSATAKTIWLSQLTERSFIY